VYANKGHSLNPIDYDTEQERHMLFKYGCIDCVTSVYIETNTVNPL